MLANELDANSSRGFHSMSLPSLSLLQLFWLSLNRLWPKATRSAGQNEWGSYITFVMINLFAVWRAIRQVKLRQDEAREKCSHE